MIVPRPVLDCLIAYTSLNKAFPYLEIVGYQRSGPFVWLDQLYAN